MLCTLALLLLVAAARGAAALEGTGVWVEHFDDASGKKYYFNEATRSTAWEPPAGAEVRYMASGGQPRDAAAAEEGGSGVLMVGLVLPPFLLVFGVLFCLYAQASIEGLSGALRGMRARRDRSAKRKGTKAGGGYRQRFKCSQDGKGGRSANS